MFWFFVKKWSARVFGKKPKSKRFGCHSVSSGGLCISTIPPLENANPSANLATLSCSPKVCSNLRRTERRRFLFLWVSVYWLLKIFKCCEVARIAAQCPLCFISAFGHFVGRCSKLQLSTGNAPEMQSRQISIWARIASHLRICASCLWTRRSSRLAAARYANDIAEMALTITGSISVFQSCAVIDAKSPTAQAGMLPKM